MTRYINKIIETEQDCPACGEPLTITAMNDFSCNRSECYTRLFNMNDTWVTHEVWFEEYIIPMMEEALIENAGA